jgi:hypothetical protein
MKGTILDFLKLAAEKPAVARELAELAAKHGIEFSDEVSDAELETVAGGADVEGQLASIGEMSQIDMSDYQQDSAQAMQTYSNISKMYHDTLKSIIQNLKA